MPTPNQILSFRLLLLFQIVEFSVSLITFITVYGRVQVGTINKTTPTVDHEDCMKLCSSSEFCVLAYGSLNCSLYNYGEVTTVLQLTQDNASLEDYVAFRIETDLTTCPIEPVTNPPTFDNYPAIGTFEKNNITYYYQIKYQNGIWSFSTIEQNNNVTCQVANFLIYQRKFGKVCMRSVGNINTTIDNFDTISADCVNNYGAKLGAFESLDEIEYMKASILKADTMLLNGKMTSECLNSGDCESIWLDETLTIPTNIPFADGYPIEGGDCLAIRKFDNTTIGLINLNCTMAYTDMFNGRKLCIMRPE